MIEGAVLEDVRGFLKGRVILTAAELDLIPRESPLPKGAKTVSKLSSAPCMWLAEAYHKR